MCVRVCVCARLCACVHACVSVCARMCAHMCTCVHVCTRIYVRTCACACTQIASCVLLVAVCGLRFSTVEHTPSHANDLIDYLNHLRGGEYSQSHATNLDDDLHTTWVTNLGSSSSHRCGWSLRIEALRCLLGVVSFILCIRLSDLFSQSMDVSMMHSCFRQMIKQDLLPCVSPL